MRVVAVVIETRREEQEGEKRREERKGHTDRSIEAENPLSGAKHPVYHVKSRYPQSIADFDQTGRAERREERERGEGRYKRRGRRRGKGRVRCKCERRSTSASRWRRSEKTREAGEMAAEGGRWLKNEVIW